MAKVYGYPLDDMYEYMLAHTDEEVKVWILNRLDDFEPDDRFRQEPEKIMEHIAKERERARQYYLIKTYDEGEAKIREIDSNKPDETTPHLLTKNPPETSTPADSVILVIGGLGCGTPLFLIAGGILAYIYFHNNRTFSFSIFQIILFAIAALGAFILMVVVAALESDQNHNQNQNTKLTTIYREFAYVLERKGIEYGINIQIELPEYAVQTQADFVSKLKECVNGPLFALIDSTPHPTREQIWDCIERAMAIKQRELGIPMLRMDVIGMTIKEPPPPPLPPPQAPPQPIPEKSTDW